MDNPRLTEIQQHFPSSEHPASLLSYRPKRLVFPYTWAGHLAFAWQLVNIAKPHVIVELGTHTGNSFGAFCQAVKEHSLDTRCHAIDTWQGDPQAGYYGSAVYQELAVHIRDHYSEIAQLHQTTFDAACAEFANESIDLLHIDGLHTYEAVRHDFETWLPKLSKQAIVLFHDTQVFDRGFGVHQYWKELENRYPSFEFLHSHGLGIIIAGTEPSPEVVKLINQAQSDPSFFREFFERISRIWLDRDALEYQQRFSGLPKEESKILDCELYLDLGQGFNEAQKLISHIKLEENQGKVIFELANCGDKLVALRFDPGSSPIALEQIQARYCNISGKWAFLESSEYSAFESIEGHLYFPDDPWIQFILPDEAIIQLEIDISIVALGSELLPMLGKQARHVLGLQSELDSHKTQQEKLWLDLETKDLAITNLKQEISLHTSNARQRDKEINKLWSDIKSKDTTIGKLNTETTKLHSSIDSLKQVIISLENDNKKLWQDIASKEADINLRINHMAEQNTAIETEAARHAQIEENLRSRLETLESENRKLWADILEKDREISLRDQKLAGRV